ncbi:MAG: UDP-N-acetylmuramate dehydrogenase [Candidatus Babeliales bacterium]
MTLNTQTGKTNSRSTLPNGILQNVPLHDKNWFGTGGPALYFTEPKTTEAFAQALSFAHEHKHDIFVLGSGANILIADEGFNGLVIRPQLTGISHTPCKDDPDHVAVTAEAGVTIENLITYCLKNQLGGLEEFSGIPGTVGGAMYINLHYFKHLLAHFVLSAEIIERSTGTRTMVELNWFEFGYDHSRLFAQQEYVLSATFKLKKITELEAAYAQGRADEITRHRKHRYPYQGTCGSFFRNFHPHEVTLEKNGKKAIWVAFYLDKIGIKGELSYGDAVVSHQHANMIVNQGNATSTNIVQLARRMQELTRENFGITPQPECQLIGFSSYPLH